MKTKTLLAMALGAAIGLLSNHATGLAQEHKDHKEHKESGGKVKVPDTVEGIWKEIHKHHTELDDAVKRISQIAEDLDKSGDAGNQATTEANLKKFDTALKNRNYSGPMDVKQVPNSRKKIFVLVLD